jgi:hypothetical protein
MLIGLSACALIPAASHASAKPSGLAFAPSMPSAVQTGVQQPGAAVRPGAGARAAPVMFMSGGSAAPKKGAKKAVKKVQRRGELSRSQTSSTLYLAPKRQPRPPRKGASFVEVLQFGVTLLNFMSSQFY